MKMSLQKILNLHNLLSGKQAYFTDFWRNGDCYFKHKYIKKKIKNINVTSLINRKAIFK